MFNKKYILPFLFSLGCATTNTQNSPNVENIYRPTGKADINKADREQIYSNLEDNFTGEYTKTENYDQTNYKTEIDLIERNSENKKVGIIKLGNEELDISKIAKIAVVKVNNNNNKRLLFAYETELKQKSGLSYLQIKYYDFEIKKDAETTAEYLETLSQDYKSINIGMIKKVDKKIKDNNYKFLKLSNKDVKVICENGNLEEKHVEIIEKMYFDDCDTDYKTEISDIKNRIIELRKKHLRKNVYLLYCGNADIRPPTKCKYKSNMELSYNRGFNLADYLYENLGNSLDNTVWMVYPNNDKKNERSVSIYFVTEKDQIVKK